MRTFITLLVFACTTGTCTAARADYDLLVRSNCLACHHIDKRKYGPKLQDVAARYAGDAQAADRLARKIREGGSGAWGEEPMPPQAQVSEGDALALARYVLSLKP